MGKGGFEVDMHPEVECAEMRKISRAPSDMALLWFGYFVSIVFSLHSSGGRGVRGNAEIEPCGGLE